MIRAPFDSLNISAKVVVCLPFLWAFEMAWTFRFRPGSIAFTNADFPTPECPASSDTLPCNSLSNASRLLPFKADTA